MMERSAGLTAASRRRPAAARAQPSETDAAAEIDSGPPPRRGDVRLVGAVFGLALGLGLAHLLVGEFAGRFIAEAVITLDAEATADLDADARRVDTAAFRGRVEDRLGDEVRQALAAPGAVAELLAEAREVVGAVVDSLAAPDTGPSASNGTPDAPVRFRLSATASADGRSLRLEAEGGAPAATAALAEIAAETMLDSRLERRRAEVDARMAALDAELTLVRDAVFSAQRRVTVADDDAVTAGHQAIVEIEQRLQAAEARLVVREADLRELRAAATTPIDLDVLLAHPRRAELAAAVEQRDRAASRVAELAATYGERHPLMAAATVEVEAQQAEIDAQVRALIDAVDGEVDEQRELVDTMRADLSHRETVLADRTTDQTMSAAIQAQMERDRERLGALTTELAELASAQVALKPDARVFVVADPVPAARPQTMALFYGAGGALGLAFGSLAGALAARRDEERVGDADQLHVASGLPILATLTGASRLGGSTAGSADALARLALRIDRGGTGPRSIALASLDGTVASTPLAVDLAQSLTGDGHEVLVVDLAVSAAGAVGRSAPGDGIGALDDARWSDALVPLDDGGPWLLGGHGRGGSERLGARLDRIFAEAGRRFDRILVAVPSLQRADGLRATRSCAATVVVLKSGHTPMPEIKATLDDLATVGAHPLGFVLVT